MSDLRVSGSQSTTGGEYDDIRVSGSFHATDDVKCKNIHSSGSSKYEKNVDCSGEIHTSGTLHIEGSVKASSLKGSGTIHFGSFEVGDTNTSGTFKSNGDVKATEIKFSGTFKCDNVEADSIDGYGKIVARGEINADRVYLKLSSVDSSEAKAIVGSKITIGRFHPHILGIHPQIMKVTTIEGDELDLNFVNADTVRGSNVKIGRKCKINRLEYSGEAEIANCAEIGEVVKL